MARHQAAHRVCDDNDFIAAIVEYIPVIGGDFIDSLVQSVGRVGVRLQPVVTDYMYWKLVFAGQRPFLSSQQIHAWCIGNQLFHQTCPQAVPSVIGSRSKDVVQGIFQPD